MELSNSHKISQEKRNFKISDVLITAWSRVQVLAGPYKKEARRFRPSCFFFCMPTADWQSVQKLYSGKHPALQIGAAEVVGIGIVNVGIEVRDLIRDKRGKNIQNTLCGIVVFHSRQYQAQIQHSDGSSRRNRIAAFRNRVPNP